MSKWQTSTGVAELIKSYIIEARKDRVEPTDIANFDYLRREVENIFPPYAPQHRIIVEMKDGRRLENGPSVANSLFTYATIVNEPKGIKSVTVDLVSVTM